MLIVLCVDGLDPDQAREWGFELEYNLKLVIPRGCYVATPEGEVPHTVKVWPTMFSGEIIDQTSTIRGPMRLAVHDFLVKYGLSWGGKKRFRVSPHNRALNTVFKERHSYEWNIPTISPTWISRFPELEDVLPFCKWEYITFHNLLRSALSSGVDLFSVYTRLIDALGHYDPSRLEWVYRDVFETARSLGSRAKVLLLSDHGIVDGAHTDFAYMGSNVPIVAESVVDVRGEIERILDEEAS